MARSNEIRIRRADVQIAELKILLDPIDPIVISFPDGRLWNNGGWVSQEKLDAERASYRITMPYNFREPAKYGLSWADNAQLMQLYEQDKPERDRKNEQQRLEVIRRLRNG